MAMHARERIDWAWFTFSRVRVSRELELERTEREAAEGLGMAYSSVRSIVEDIKECLGVRTVREIRLWWRANRELWAACALEQAGLSKEGYAG